MKVLKNLLIVIITLAIFSACKQKINKIITIKQKPTIETLEPREYSKRIKTVEVQLVDVRTTLEFKQGHIKNAVNINIQDSSNFTKQIIKYEKNRPVYVYCTAGGKRSLTATKILKANGFNAINLEGGLTEWTKNEYKVITSNIN